MVFEGFPPFIKCDIWAIPPWHQGLVECLGTGYYILICVAVPSVGRTHLFYGGVAGVLGEFLVQSLGLITWEYKQWHVYVLVSPLLVGLMWGAWLWAFMRLSDLLPFRARSWFDAAAATSLASALEPAAVSLGWWSYGMQSAVDELRPLFDVPPLVYTCYFYAFFAYSFVFRLSSNACRITGAFVLVALGFGVALLALCNLVALALPMTVVVGLILVALYYISWRFEPRKQLAAEKGGTHVLVLALGLPVCIHSYCLVANIFLGLWMPVSFGILSLGSLSFVARYLMKMRPALHTDGDVSAA